MRHCRAVLLLLLAAVGGAAAGGVAAEQRPHGAVVAPHPLAAAAAQAVLHAGGSAADAAIAAQMMLSVVAPQNSGLGGGSILLHLDGRTGALTGWDGMEAAPALATPELFAGPGGKVLPAAGGRAVGVPGTVRALEALYREYGRLPWADLLAPAIRAAEDGVPVSAPLAGAIAAQAGRLRREPAARALFFAPDGTPLPAGARLADPALAQTLREVAAGGADALMRGALAADIAKAVRGDEEPGLLTADDLAAYAARRQPPACAPYRDHVACVAGPPGAGLDVLAALGLLVHLDLAHLDPSGPDAARLLIGAGNQARAGQPPGLPAQPEQGADTVAVVDGAGNAVCLTSSLGEPFGAGLVVRGVVLNAALAGFAPPAANRAGPGKRPPMAAAAAVLLGPGGGLEAVIGSAGSSLAPDFVVQAVAGLVDWGLSPAGALALPHVAGTEAETPALAEALEALGQPVTLRPMRSDTAIIVAHPAVEAAADKRREGDVAGD